MNKFLQNGVYYGILGLWLYWTYGMVVSEPWMINTHGQVRHTGWSLDIGFREKLTTVVSHTTKKIIMPRWDSVKTFKLRFTVSETSRLKQSILAISQCKPKWTLSCHDGQGNALAYMNLGEMVQGTLFTEFRQMWTPSPQMGRVTYEDEKNAWDTSSLCSLLMHVNTSSVNCKAVEEYVSMDVLWDIQIIPQWHWTDWIPREFAEDVFDTATTIHGFVGLGKEPPKHWTVKETASK